MEKNIQRDEMFTMARCQFSTRSLALKAGARYYLAIERKTPTASGLQMAFNFYPMTRRPMVGQR